VTEIRPAEREDMEALFALDRVCFRPGIAYSKAELKYFLFHRAGVSLVAADASGIAGFAIAEMRMEHGEPIGHIVTIDVDPVRRRQGAGRLLMHVLMERCREAGAARIRLEVAVDNDGAIAFYKELGFAEAGRIRGYYMGRLDALVMERGVAEAAS
jgi:[ribosomal protein S18]-alanine N-acetyltransferase